MATYQTPLFELTIPSSWSDVTTYVLVGPEDSTTGFRANVVVQQRDVEPDEILEVVAEAEIDAVGEDLIDPELLERGPMNGCAVAAYGARWTWTTEEDLDLYQRQVYMLASSRLYILTCTCLKEDRRMMDEAFLRIAESFQPKV